MSSESEVDELLVRVTAGDGSAREQLFELHRARLKRMVTFRLDRRIQQRVDPSDIIQETLIQADRRLDEYLRHQPIPFYPWLRQLAWDQLVMAMRKHAYAERRSTLREESLKPNFSDESVAELATVLVDDSEEPLTKVIRAETLARLRKSIGSLADADREILVLRYLEQLSTAETATVLNLGQSAVKMRHLRAIKRLKELLDQDLKDSST